MSATGKRPENGKTKRRPNDANKSTKGNHRKGRGSTSRPKNQTPASNRQAGSSNAAKADSRLTHVNERGEMHMVDVGEKPATTRVAIAEARVKLGRKALAEAKSDNSKKGDVLAAVRLAGIQAAKQTSQLIPLCHQLSLSNVTVDIELETSGAIIVCRAKTTGPTGVEMEAMTGASVAALTMYDMLKAVERGIEIQSIRLLDKQGGRSGHWQRKRPRG